MSGRRFQILLALAALGGGACEPEVVQSTASKTDQPAKSQAPDAGAADGGQASTANIDFQEVDFVESERSRDPFRSFADTFVEEARGRVKSQREVILDQYAIDELRLVAIVTGVKPARAMLVDPTGKGHVVLRGQFVGRPETVQAPGQASVAYEVNWRVDRIRDGDIVLVREDPTNPDVPTATRTIAMRPEGELTKLQD
jgi:type IV pilus assembly protein PilP